MTNYSFITELKRAISFTEGLSLRNMYLPLIGQDAVTFYNYLIDHNYICNDSLGMTDFEETAKFTGLSLFQIAEAQKMLEAVGLLRTFESADGKKLIFTILPPSEPEKIKKNPVLFRKVIDKIGKVQFERIFFITKNKEFSKSEYKETTSKYQDVFDLTFQSEHDHETEDTLNMPVHSITNIDDAIKGLTAIQFVKYMSQRDASPSQIQMIQRLITGGLISEAINHIIKYSYDINGKIVSNHIEAIGNDFITKGFFEPKQVETELFHALESKNKVDNPFFEDQPQEEMQTKIEAVSSHPTDENHSEDKWAELFNSLGGDL